MNNPTVRELVESWRHSMPSRALTPLVADGVAATSRGTFLGENTSDPAASGVAIYSETENLPTAIASILNHSQNKANFHPATTPPDELAARFNRYAEEIDKNPFFHLQTSDSSREKFYSSDYNLLIDQVVNLYQGVNGNDLDVIKKAIADMGKAVFSTQKDERWKNLFSQSTINMSNLENPKFYLYYTSLHMLHDKEGKSEVSEQDYEVRMVSYLILPDLIKANAETLATLDKKSVDDWMGGSTSPERKNAQLCFRPTAFKR